MKFRYKFIIIVFVLFFSSGLKAQTCNIYYFKYEGSLPDSCTKYNFYAYASVIGGQTYTVTYNYGDSSPLENYTFAPSGTYFITTASHKYNAQGVYTTSITINGSNGCYSLLTQSVSVVCAACKGYTVLSTGYDRYNKQPLNNSGNFDPWWYVLKKQYVGAGPSYIPYGPETFFSSGTHAYDIAPYNGYGYSITSGDARYISVNSSWPSQDPTSNNVTYRTYFKMPASLPANKSYSLAISIRGDDAIYRVMLNNKNIKPVGFSATGNSYTGSPLLLSVSSCDSTYFLPDTNYIDITVGDLGYFATQLTAEIILYTCSSCVPYPPCSDCISSFAPVPGKRYLVSAWAKENGAAQSTTTYTKPQLSVLFPSVSSSVGPFAPSGAIIDGWQRIEGEFTIPSSATDISLKLDCTSGTCFYDDVRVLPFDGSMKSYVYDPVNMRLVAELDERNYATLYEYDEEGKLVRVKKETEKGIMTIQENRNNTKK